MVYKAVDTPQGIQYWVHWDGTEPLSTSLELCPKARLQSYINLTSVARGVVTSSVAVPTEGETDNSRQRQGFRKDAVVKDVKETNAYIALETRAEVLAKENEKLRGQIRELQKEKLDYLQSSEYQELRAKDKRISELERELNRVKEERKLLINQDRNLKAAKKALDEREKYEEVNEKRKSELIAEQEALRKEIKEIGMRLRHIRGEYEICTKAIAEMKSYLGTPVDTLK